MIAPIDFSDRIAELLVHIGRVARREPEGSDLTAAQWACLRFFARANGSTRTPSGFASFQATTRGTASQIVKSLEARGLIARARSDRDGRSVRFDLTDAGHALLRRDPLRDMMDVVGRLDRTEMARFHATLSRLVAGLADRRATPIFGTCRDCSHFAPLGNAGHCRCMAAELAPGEIDSLCAVFAPTRDPKPEGQHDART
jgi:DNA-binding MarR family transcriptional regulator